MKRFTEKAPFRLGGKGLCGWFLSEVEDLFGLDTLLGGLCQVGGGVTIGLLRYSGQKHVELSLTGVGWGI